VDLARCDGRFAGLGCEPVRDPVVGSVTGRPCRGPDLVDPTGRGPVSGRGIGPVSGRGIGPVPRRGIEPVSARGASRRPVRGAGPAPWRGG